MRTARAATSVMRISSGSCTTDISAVALISTSQTLPRPGIAKRQTCGSMMRRKASVRLMPAAYAASIWPRSSARGTADRPTRRVICAPSQKTQPYPRKLSTPSGLGQNPLSASPEALRGRSVNVELEVLFVDRLIGAILADLVDRLVEGRAQVVL